MFNVSKGRAFYFVVAFGSIAILFLALRLWTCAFPFVVISGFFVYDLYRRWNRDRQLITRAREEARFIPSTPVQRLELPKTSKDSSHMFVPKPLDRGDQS